MDRHRGYHAADGISQLDRRTEGQWVRNLRIPKHRPSYTCRNKLYLNTEYRGTGREERVDALSQTYAQKDSEKNATRQKTDACKCTGTSFMIRLNTDEYSEKIRTVQSHRRTDSGLQGGGRSYEKEGSLQKQQDGYGNDKQR